MKKRQMFLLEVDVLTEEEEKRGVKGKTYLTVSDPKAKKVIDFQTFDSLPQGMTYLAGGIMALLTELAEHISKTAESSKKAN